MDAVTLYRSKHPDTELPVMGKNPKFTAILSGEGGHLVALDQWGLMDERPAGQQPAAEQYGLAPGFIRNDTQFDVGRRS